MTLPPSASDPISSSFDLLSEQIRRWIWQQGWEELRDIQERSIRAILQEDRDVILAAATASGKTEAAFLPLLSQLVATHDQTVGFKAVYISPLKALINDQFRRLDQLCEVLEIPVHRWHGDVSASAKSRARRSPDGILLITPESLEATFVRRGLEVQQMFQSTAAVVIDEIHAFIGSERGMQLQSLLHRLEVVVGRRIRRLGLSATLGDMQLAAEFLRPNDPSGVQIIESRSEGQELRVQLRGYVRAANISVADDFDIESMDSGASKSEPAAETESSVERAISNHIFARLRGGHNLIFAGSRQNVELYSDRLRQMAEGLGVPNEFYPHHSNLSKGHREFVEERMRRGSLPTSAVCTSTLELGIDIGEVESVAQISTPWSVAGLRQRLGRSGRRLDKPAILRMYVTEDELHSGLHPVDALRCDLFQGISMIRLLVQGWCEPPTHLGFHFSTLVHQVLALISQYGGITAQQAYSVLCGTGPFSAVTQTLFTDVLRVMGATGSDLIEQAPDGTLLLGSNGERIANGYDFYAVFLTPQEFRIVNDGKELGTLPVLFLISPGKTIIFSGRRWLIRDIDDRRKVIDVVPTTAGRPPPFGGQVGDIHDRVVEEMRAVYQEIKIPAFLDSTAKDLLDQGRKEFQQQRLSQRSIIQSGDDVFIFPWVGTIKRDTLLLALGEAGLNAEARGIVIEVNDCPLDEVSNVLGTLANSPAPDPVSLATSAVNRIRQKYDAYLTDELLILGLASERVESKSLPKLCSQLLMVLN